MEGYSCHAAGAGHSLCTSGSCVQSMGSTIRVPEQRACQECGRRERWDATEENWVVEDDAVGEVYCIHSWDITGEFRPVHG